MWCFCFGLRDWRVLITESRRGRSGPSIAESG
jgi:hypothetical protein